MLKLPSLSRRLVLFGAISVLAGCTAVAVDPAEVANVKSVTVVKLEVPEYQYLGNATENAVKSLGVSAAGYSFGALGIVVTGVAITKFEQPYREAIGRALAPREPSFATTFNAELESLLKQRGIETVWTAAPPMLADKSGYDMAAGSYGTDYVVELVPRVGFAFDNEAGYPLVNVRWRLFKRYPGDKYIETNRGYIAYQDKAPSMPDMPALGYVPTVAAYRFPGHAAQLADHGDAPAAALRDIARQTAKLTLQRALPTKMQ